MKGRGEVVVGGEEVGEELDDLDEEVGVGD